LNPCCQERSKCLCCEWYSGTTGCYTKEEGLCMSVEKCLCCLRICTFPPGGSSADGIPLCALCNKRCGGLAFKGDLCHGNDKCLCLHSSCQTAHCMTDEGCCYRNVKCCCWVEQCGCPPGGGKNDGVPVMALFGKVCIGGGKNKIEAPKQEEMS